MRRNLAFLDVDHVIRVGPARRPEVNAAGAKGTPESPGL